MRYFIIALIIFCIPSNGFSIEGKYTNAIDTAQLAFYKQTGAEDHIKKLGDLSKARLKDLGVYGIAEPIFFIGNIIYKKKFRTTYRGFYMNMEEKGIELGVRLGF